VASSALVGSAAYVLVVDAEAVGVEAVDVKVAEQELEHAVSKDQSELLASLIQSPLQELVLSCGRVMDSWVFATLTATDYSRQMTALLDLVRGVKTVRFVLPGFLVVQVKLVETTRS
jgi:hypothetical protein